MKSEKLQAKISKYFTVFTIRVITTLSVIISLYSSYKLQAETGENLADTARQISMQLDQFMWNHHHQLDLLKTADVLVIDDSYQITSTLINQFHDSFPSSSWVGVTDADDIVKASSGDILLDSGISERPVFIQGAKGNFIGDVHEALLLSDLPPNPANEPLRFVDISSPLYDQNGGFKGVLAAHLNWDQAQERVSTTIESFRDSQKIEVLVLSKDHDVLLGPKKLIGASLVQTMAKTDQDNDRQWASIIQPNDQTYLTGFIVSTSYNDYDDLGWTIVVRQSVEIAYNNIVQLVLLLIAGGGILLLLFMMLSSIISKKLTELLNRLSEVATLLKSSRKVPMPDSNGICEFENLRSALSNLFSDLNITDAALSEMKTIATTDPLTSLKNGLRFENSINQCSKTLDPLSHSLAILYLDLGGLEIINDRYSHDIGGKLLIKISSRLTTAARSNEILSRIGEGESLPALIVLVGAAISVIKPIARHIIEAIDRSFPCETRGIQVGCSIGCAVYPEDSTELQTVVKYADKASYYSRYHGKNRFTMYSSGISSRQKAAGVGETP